MDTRYTLGVHTRVYTSTRECPQACICSECIVALDARDTRFRGATESSRVHGGTLFHWQKQPSPCPTATRSPSPPRPTIAKPSLLRLSRSLPLASSTVRFFFSSANDQFNANFKMSPIFYLWNNCETIGLSKAISQIIKDKRTGVLYREEGKMCFASILNFHKFLYFYFYFSLSFFFFW